MTQTATFQSAAALTAAPTEVLTKSPRSERPRKAGFETLGRDGEVFVDFKNVDELRRLMTPNGKIYSRKRLGVTARQQRTISQAVKRARQMGLLPYTSATL